MYRVPSEFIRQKNTLFGPITVAHAVGAFGGYLLAQASDSVWLSIAGVVLGLAVTTVRVQGLVLYQFVPLAVAYLLRRLTGDVLEPEDAPSVVPTTGFVVYDEEGRPLILQEEG